MRKENKKIHNPELIKVDDSNIFMVKIHQTFTDACMEYDRQWDMDFKKHIAENYPYTMSPETTQLIATGSEFIKNNMASFGFTVNPWDTGRMEREPYVLGVLRRVCVTDTIEPIFDNTDKMANYLHQIANNDKERILQIRSFFTGAGVAEKCLISRLHTKGLRNFNLITTDNSAESIAVAALNLQLWNSSLKPEDQYAIKIVDGDIPKDLYYSNRTIILQVGDALQCSQNDIKAKPMFDALLLDNGLPYLDRHYGNDLLLSVCKNMGNDGLIVAALGLDANIKVEIDTTYHLSMIFKALRTDLRKDPRINSFQAPYDYPHYYEFISKEDGSILIKKVVSDGAGRTYNWLALLLRTNPGKLVKILKTIKSATELSRVKDAVITTPFETHMQFVNHLLSQDLIFEEIEKPLEYEKLGWSRSGEDLFVQGERVVNTKELMDICREDDPLVLRKSIIKIKPKG